MAKVKLNTGGKALIAILALALIGIAVWQLIPKKSADGPTVEIPKIGEGAEEKTTGTASTGPSTPGIDRPIRVAIVTWGGFAGGIMANNGFGPNKDSTFWKEYGIEVDLRVIDDFPASRDAFKKGGDDGGVDIMWSTVDSFSLEYPTLKDLNPVTIMQYDWSRGGDAIAVTKEIQKVSDLKGKRIAVAEATPSHYFALYLLSQADMKIGDVNWVFTESAIEAAALFRQGKVDAGVSWSPDVYQAADDREGGHILASTKDATSLIADIFVARGDFAKKHPELIAKFLLGWFDGTEQVLKDSAKVESLMTKGFEGVGPEDAKGMLGDVKLPTYAENLAFFEITGSQLRGYDAIYNESTNIWRALGKTSGRTQPGETKDTSFLSAIRPEAERRFGKIEATAATKEFAFDFDAAKAEQQKTQEAILTKQISIFFPTGKSELDGNARVILDDAAMLAQTFGSNRMRVTGNTDSVGNKDSNIKLSERRAQAVVNYLIEKHGFPKDKFVVVGAGPNKPVASNDTEEGRQQNRRTDFEIIR